VIHQARWYSVRAASRILFTLLRGGGGGFTFYISNYVNFLKILIQLNVVSIAVPVISYPTLQLSVTPSDSHSDIVLFESRHQFSFITDVSRGFLVFLQVWVQNSNLESYRHILYISLVTVLILSYSLKLNICTCYSIIKYSKEIKQSWQSQLFYKKVLA